ncbi:MAG: alpha/beta hydrolase [Rhodobacterales bacterium]|nr:MAG: alpha/beta hydrolase [Rhodobacterales bacterium]
MLNSITEGMPELPPLLIAHGLYGQARNWGQIARDLSDIRHSTLVDMRNHGDSPWFDTHGYEEMAEDLAGMIDGSSDVLGHSMGGKAAMTLALSHPEKVRRLIVADIAPVPYDHDQQSIMDAMRRLDLSQISRRTEAAKALNLTPDVAGFLSQSIDLKERAWKMNLDVLEAELPRILSFPTFHTPFDGPALFLAGAESDYVQPEHRAEIKRLFPKAHIARIPQTGHWLHAQRPDAVTAAIRAFLTA